MTARPIYSFPEPEKTSAWKPEDRGEPRDRGESDCHLYVAPQSSLEYQVH